MRELETNTQAALNAQMNDAQAIFNAQVEDIPRRHAYHYERLLLEYKRVHKEGRDYDRKHVHRIECGDCDSVLTDRAMDAVLLSDRSVTLFSTDLTPTSVGFVHGDYVAASCTCRVRDTACLTCGNVVGYHVNVPCKVCLGQPNNGHYWMFRSSQIRAQQIFMRTSTNVDLPLIWGLVRDAGDFYCGTYRSGYQEGAEKSCALVIKFIPADIVHLHVTKPMWTIVPHLECLRNNDALIQYIARNHFR